MLSIMRTDRAKHRDALEAESFRDWLERHKQSDRAIIALWDLLTLPVFNDTVDAVSAYMGLMFFQDGMLAGRHSADIGISRVGLTELVGDAARRYIEDRGGQVLTGQNVTGIKMEDGIVTGVTSGGDFISADAIVTAVPWDALPRLLPPDIASDAYFAAPKLEWAPIINVHVWYDRPIIDEPFLAVLDSPLQWVFNRTHFKGRPGPDSTCAFQSAARGSTRPWDGTPYERSSSTRWLGSSRSCGNANVERFLVVKQVNATFRCTPGAQSLRPLQRTPIPGLTLAGDWTQTGWPATMESAVRSGLLAAEEAAAGLERH